MKASQAVALKKKGKASGGKRPRQQLNAESGARKGAARGTSGHAKRQKTQNGQPKPKQKQKQQPAGQPEPEEEGSSEEDVDEEDLDFVRCLGAPAAAFLSSLDAADAPKPGHLPPKQPPKPKPAVQQQEHRASDDEGHETTYEQRRQTRAPETQEEEAVPRLPVKGPDGTLTYEKGAPRARIPSVVTRVEGVVVEEASEDEELSDANADVADAAVAASAAAAAITAVPAALPTAEPAAPDTVSDSDSDLQAFQDAEERQDELKQQMAIACNQLLKDPEAHTRNLRALLALTVDVDTEIVRLAMLSLLAVFRDILPGYRIRLPTEKELAMPVSKDVKRTRDYEASLLRLYQAYVKQLTKAAAGTDGGNADGGRAAALGQVAMHCMQGLLAARPDFNCASELLQAVVPAMAHRDKAVAAAACSAVAAVVKADTGGETLLEVTQLVADLVKRRDCRCKPEVLSCLYGMDIRDAELGSLERKRGGKAKKRKKRGDAEDVAAAMKEADAVADFQVSKQRKSLVLEALFEILFRVLKHAAGGSARQQQQQQQQRQQQDGSAAAAAAAAGAGRRGSKGHGAFPLLAAALEGVRRFAHHISVDYFADLTAALAALTRRQALALPLRLQALATGVHVSRIQQDSTTDQQSFLDDLCGVAGAVPLAPLLQGGDGGGDAAVFANAASLAGQQPQAAALLVRAAQDMLCSGGMLLDARRVATAAKQLGLTAVHGDSGTAMGLLTVVGRLLGRQPRLASMLEHEPGTPAVAPTHAQLQALFAASASAGVLWELTLLQHHYHPHVAAKAKAVAQRSSADAAADATVVAASYSVSEGAFRPTPTQPLARRKAGAAARRAAVPAPSSAFAAATGGRADDAASDKQLRKVLKVVRQNRSTNMRARGAQERQLRLLRLQLSEFKQHLRTEEIMASA